MSMRFPGSTLYDHASRLFVLLAERRSAAQVLEICPRLLGVIEHEREVSLCLVLLAQRSAQCVELLGQLLSHRSP
jgi:hypothetical protein